MATSGWIVNSGNDSLGFNAKGLGYCFYSPPVINALYLTDAMFWCSTLNSYGQSGTNACGNTQVLNIVQQEGDPQSSSPATVQ